MQSGRGVAYLTHIVLIIIPTRLNTHYLLFGLMGKYINSLKRILFLIQGVNRESTNLKRNWRIYTLSDTFFIILVKEIIRKILTEDALNHSLLFDQKQIAKVVASTSFTRFDTVWLLALPNENSNKRVWFFWYSRARGKTTEEHSGKWFRYVLNSDSTT